MGNYAMDGLEADSAEQPQGPGKTLKNDSLKSRKTEFSFLPSTIAEPCWSLNGRPK
jgi:hypothetical protein